MRRELHPHQSKAIDLLRQSLGLGKRRPILQAPTGYGKTIVAGAIIESALGKGKRVIFTVPLLSLCDQTVERFAEEGINAVGVLQGMHALTNCEMPIQVASVQTLSRRAIPPADLVLVDECHKQFRFINHWLASPEMARVPVIGLSATPWARGLGRTYDDLIVGARIRELIDAGFLSDYRVFAPSHPDLAGVRTVAGDFHEGELSEAMSKPALVADVVSTWKRLGENRTTLVFGVDRAHARRLVAEFEAAGVSTAYIDAFTESAERKAIFARFAEGLARVIVSVATLTVGIDLDVRCIVLARPTKSEMLYVQIVGRGLRTAEGKDHCILRDTPVLTDAGEVKIQNLTAAHKVWDGQNFVSHGGSVCMGVRRVVSHDGITATPEHKVMTNEGWMQLAEAARRCKRIARTGFGGVPIRFTDDCFSENRGERLEFVRGGTLSRLRGDLDGPLPQSRKASSEGLSRVPSASAAQSSEVALCEVSGAAGSLPEPELQDLPRLRWARDRVSLRLSEWCRAMGGGESGHPIGQGDAIGPDHQRWALRAREFALGFTGREQQQSESVGRPFPLYPSSREAPSREVRGRDFEEDDRGGTVRDADSGEMGEAFEQAEGEVWDVLNAGPLQRFTANGRLVHNCLILDHSDTTLRLGFPDSIHYDTLDDGSPRTSSQRKEREEPKPKECPQCSFLKLPKVHVCPSCGFAPERQSNVLSLDGELSEFDTAKAKKFHKADRNTKQRWYSMLRWVAHQRGYRPGWVSNQYRAKFDVWPQGLIDISVPPDAEVLNWIRYRMIRYAKSKAKRAAA